VLGGIERQKREGNKRQIFLEVVSDRSSSTLLEIIKRRIKPGSHIVTDCWGAYNDLTSLGYKHSTVNHSKNFVDPITKENTNTIEGNWLYVRRHLGLHGVRGSNISTNLFDFLYRQSINNNFDHFINDVSMTALSDIDSVNKMFKDIKKKEEIIENKEKTLSKLSFNMYEINKTKNINNIEKSIKIQEALDDYQNNDDNEKIIDLSESISDEEKSTKILEEKKEELSDISELFEDNSEILSAPVSQQSYCLSEHESDSEMEKTNCNINKYMKRKRKSRKGKFLGKQNYKIINTEDEKTINMNLLQELENYRCSKEAHLNKRNLKLKEKEIKVLRKGKDVIEKGHTEERKVLQMIRLEASNPEFDYSRNLEEIDEEGNKYIDDSDYVPIKKKKKF
jgi:hypothetical protein